MFKGLAGFLQFFNLVNQGSSAAEVPDDHGGGLLRVEELGNGMADRQSFRHFGVDQRIFECFDFSTVS